MPYTIKPGSFKYKKSNGQFSEIDCFEGPDLTEEVAALEKGKAPIIIDSATGNPIAIKDGADGLPVEGMKIHFTPKQDLHGYDSPWPVGGGKNLVNIAPVKVTSQTTIGGAFSLKAGTYSFSLTAKNNTAIPGAMKITVNGSQVGTSGGIYANTTNRIKIQNITLDSDSSNVGIVISASTAGYDIDISDVQVETGSSSTDFAPYSNICPISGWTGITAHRAGKNLIPYPYKSTSGTYSGVTYSINSDGTVNLHGTASQTLFIDVYGNNTTTVSRLATLKDIGFNAGDMITLSSNFSGRLLFQFNKADGTLTSPSAIYSDNGVTVTATIPSDAVYGYICLRVANGVAINQDNVWFMIQKGSTASPYTPYIGQSYPVMFPAMGKNLCFSVMNKAISLTQDGVIVLDTPGTALLFYCKKGESYTYSGVDNNRNLFAIFDSVPAIGSVTSVIKQNTGLTNKTFVADKDGFGAFYVANSVIDTSMAQIELGSTATAYEPFDAIYGGTLDVVNGVLTEEWYNIPLNSGIYKSNETQNNVVFYKSIGIIVDGYEVISNRFSPKTPSDTPGRVAISNNTLYFVIPKNELTTYDSNGFDTWLESHPTIFLVQRETPYEIQLDPITVQTLLGDNTLWSDANGTIELNYRADTKLFCQKNDSVDDVRVNGASVLNNGVANIPLANGSTWGAVKIGSGLYVGETSGVLQTNRASSTQIKAATNNNNPIVPQMQHESIFYGLAKLAGADMSSSSNAIGTFTPEAIVAIQKMLGVYQAPWELIREDTVTNAEESDIEITVDGNGLPFELTDVRIVFDSPLQDTQFSIGSYGAFKCYYDSSNSLNAYIGAYTQAPNATQRFSFVEILQENDMCKISYIKNGVRGDDLPWRSNGSEGAFTLPNSKRIMNKVVIVKITGTAHYKLYGRRKWTT